ncbi:hypothetical protein OF83DRAFT_1177271 [Amylostereum chailletii]|nr:hypothetical protein OF83DRAFT_1177271 [Amylostereum chailletii]
MSLNSATDSSSPKRAASEDPSASQDSSATSRSPRAQEISHLSLSDPSSNDIDATMSDILPTFTTVSDDPQPHTGTTPPGLRHQTIQVLRKQPMQEGQTWHLIAKPWFRRWEKAVTGEQDKEGGIDEKDIGPVDNSSLVTSTGELSTNPQEGIDVEFVPTQVWNYFVQWYGQPQYSLPRTVILRGISHQPTLELHPPRLRVFRVIDAPGSVFTSGDAEHRITVSSARRVKDLLRDLADTVEPASVDEYRVWKIESEGLTGSDYPSGKIIQDKSTILQTSEETLDDALIADGDSFAVEFMKAGAWIVDTSNRRPGDGSDATLSGVPPPLFGQDNDFFSSSRFQSNKTMSPGAGPSTSTFFKPAASAPAIRQKPAIELGTLGLSNMGNTCFMNSALQCLAHTPELADYFLTNVYSDELNPDNPLGMGGAIAETFGALLGRIWAPSSQSTSYSPREFKSALSRFAPQFSGYQQHDSQELVAFLLDGLHEDLNRVLKKPYVEKPDWEGGDERELVKLARESWEGYMKRNDSVIVDLFQGQYKSTLVCPECSKVSITFDPFMYLTLPLPIYKKWRHTIYYVPYDPDKEHVKVPIEIGRDASFKDLRQLLGRWMGANPDNLLTIEIFSHRFYKNLHDYVLCGEIAESDTIVCYELPCHAQQSRTYVSKKTDNDPFIVPVFLSCTSPARHSSSNRSNPTLFGYPFILAIDREDARSVERMEGLIVGQLRRWTRNFRDLWSWESVDSPMAEVQIPIPGARVADSVTEIKENGDVVTIQGPTVEEGDIVDEKAMLVDEDTSTEAPDRNSGDELRRVGLKQGIFTVKLQAHQKDFGEGFNTGYGSHAPRPESWEDRRNNTTMDGEDETPVLLSRDDALTLEFDENMKAYFFGEEGNRWEHALFHSWQTFKHEEYIAAERASNSKVEKGISLQDCLDEFTKEEQLSEDDLWYCPSCKKHQQATKKFDLWSVPDILVVHLKRFSNSRALRDKIETFVDFPLQNLDLTEMAQERQVAKQLQTQGVDISELGLGDLDEPLMYDLYAVDEHLGGLGGGHYRAYAHNHVTKKWYHFDDSYVTESRPDDAVNANAYLLFYKRRASRPLGGKTHTKIEAARSKAESSGSSDDTTFMNTDSQLPTPPNELTPPVLPRRLGEREYSPARSLGSTYGPSTRWAATPQTTSSPSSSPPPLDDGDPPSFDEAPFDDVLQTSVLELDPLALESHHFDFPDPSTKASPTSSNEAELDSDDDNDNFLPRSRRWKYANDSRMDDPDADEWDSDPRTQLSSGTGEGEGESLEVVDKERESEPVDGLRLTL